MKNIKKKLTMAFGIALCAISFNALADDCYYAFLSSSANDSCSVAEVYFQPGSTEWCRVHVYCSSNGNGSPMYENDESVPYADVPKLANCGGHLKVGSCSKMAKTVNLPGQPAQRIIRK